MKIKTTNYAALFASDAETLLRQRFEALTQCSEQIAQIKSRIEEQEKEQQRLSQRIERLTDQTVNRMASGQMEEIKRLKTDLRKMKQDLKFSVELTEKAKSEILPEKTRQRDNARRELSNDLVRLMRQKRPIADQRVNDLVKAAIAEWRDFLDAFRQIGRDFGISLVINDESLMPGILPMEEIRELERRFEILQARQKLEAAAHGS
jgi:seryl-tRNA synthetase